jgi:hypothetical protein
MGFAPFGHNRPLRHMIYANGEEIGAMAKAMAVQLNFFMGRNPTRRPG